MLKFVKKLDMTFENGENGICSLQYGWEKISWRSLGRILSAVGGCAMNYS